MRKAIVIAFFTICSICAYGQYGGVTPHFVPRQYYDPSDELQQYEQPEESIIVEAYYIATDYNNNKKLRPVRIKIKYSNSRYQIGNTPNCYITSYFDASTGGWLSCGTTSVSRLIAHDDLSNYLSQYFDYAASISEYGMIYFNL